MHPKPRLMQGGQKGSWEKGDALKNQGMRAERTENFGNV